MHSVKFPSIPHPPIAGVVVGFAVFMLLTALSTSASCALAQGTTLTASTSTSSGKMTAAKSTPPDIATPKPSVKPDWKELTAVQQQSLKPLAANWATMGEVQKRKWIAISKNYPSLPPTEQAKLHSRMTEWVTLTQQQRSQARLNFAETRKIAPTEKTATWQAYQALSPEEKQKLAAKAGPKDKGAAVAIRPVSAQKLASVPVTRKSVQDASRIAIAPQTLDHNTLLPLQPAESASGQKN